MSDDKRFLLEYTINKTTNTSYIELIDFKDNFYIEYPVDTSNILILDRVYKVIDIKLSYDNEMYDKLSYTVDEDTFQELLIKLNNPVKSSMSLDVYFDNQIIDRFDTLMYDKTKCHGVEVKNAKGSLHKILWKDLKKKYNKHFVNNRSIYHNVMRDINKGLYSYKAFDSNNAKYLSKIPF